jgi:hypothetical protein
MRLRGLVLAALAAAAVACGGAQAHQKVQLFTRLPLSIGSVTPELLDPTLQDLTISLAQRANLADNARVTVLWQRGQRVIDPGQLGDLNTGVQKSLAAGVDVYLDVYPNGSSQSPNSTADQADFASWTASIVAGLPGIRHVIVGNESNLNLFWMPQFGSSGQDLAAVGYERLLARTYDAVKAAAPQVEVVGGALAHSGTDKRGTGRDTHSPAQFILDMGTAYRASHRTKPIMDAFSYHPYMERSDLPPTFRHIRGKTLTIADYGKLVSVLKRAFGGTNQKGATLPIVYDEFGVEAQVPPQYASLYSGNEPPTTHPVSEATQAKYYAQAMHLAACQPTVRTFMVFRLIDSPFLESFQSGVYYADRETPKSSRTPVAASARLYRSRAIAGCASLLAPTPLIDWGKRQITCDEDCLYIETWRRVGSSGPAASIRGTVLAGVTTGLAQAKLPAGRYRVTIRVTATAYKANAFTKTFG